MTNPKGSHNSYITLSDAELYTRINQARKDERDTLIGEIERFVSKDIYTDEDGNNLIDVEKLRTKLNELREVRGEKARRENN